MRENFERFTSVVDSHKGPWWYHLAAMLGGFFPWAVFVPQSLARAFQSKPAISAQNAYGILGRYHAIDKEQDFLLFAACWVTVTLVFFSLSVSKLLTYTLPAFPALAVVVGSEIGYLVKSSRFKRLLVPLLLLAIVYGASSIASPLILSRLRDAPAELYSLVSGYALFQSAVVVLSLGFALSRRFTWSIATFALLTFCSSAYCGELVAGLLSNKWEGPIPAFARFAGQSKYPVFVFGMRKPGVPFYTCRKVINPADFNVLCSELNKLDSAYILTRRAASPLFATVAGCRVVSQEGAFMLVEWQRSRRL